MTVPSPSRIPETALQKEVRIFLQQIKRLINCFLNWAFDMTEQGSKRRRNILLLLILLILFLILRTLLEWVI